MKVEWVEELNECRLALEMSKILPTMISRGRAGKIRFKKS